MKCTKTHVEVISLLLVAPNFWVEGLLENVIIGNYAKRFFQPCVVASNCVVKLNRCIILK